MPLQLVYLMRYFETGAQDQISERQAYLTAVLICLTTLCSAILDHPYCFLLQKLGMRIRVALCSVIYKKSLRLNHKSLNEANTGHIVNLMSNDVTRFDVSMFYLPYIYIAPLELASIFYILYVYIGISTVTGYVLMLVIVVLQKLVSRNFSKLRLAIATFTDKRVNMMSEILSGMRVIKLYCWEEYFIDVVMKIRRSECTQLFRAAYLKSVVICAAYYSIVKLSICGSVITYTLVADDALTARAVFVLMGVYNILKLDVGWMLPCAFRQAHEIGVSLKRIQHFLELEEYDSTRMLTAEVLDDYDNISSDECDPKKKLLPDKESNDKEPSRRQRLIKRHRSKSYKKNMDKFVISVKNASTPWRELEFKEKIPILEDISFEIKHGELVAIIGPVGSGKSSILMALLGEIPTVPAASVRKLDGSVSFASQEPWVFSSSFRQNILFGRDMDRRRYRRVIECLALDKDLDKMPDKDYTVVGERGMSLSGGQRARLNLARAVYADADIILMDDPLAAVDVNVGRHLFDRCIKGELKGKTRILVTHQLQYIKEVDKIIIIKNGRIENIGSYQSLTDNGIDFTKYLYEKKEETNIKTKHNFERSLSVSLEKSMYTSCDYFTSLNSGSYKVKNTVGEDLSLGHLDWSLYKKYLWYGANTCMIMFCVVTNALLAICNVFNDWLLATWSGNQIANSTANATAMPSSILSARLTDSLQDYIIIYTSNIALIIFLATINSILIYYITINASKELHNAMLKSIFRAPISFFDKNPVGRILNRFSKDTGQLDEQMTDNIYELSSTLFSIISIIVVTAIPTPVILVALVPLGIISYYTKKFAISTSKEVKRIEGATRSPVFTHASASMFGLTTIRAFGLQEKFEQEFDQHQNLHSESWFLYLAVTRWMSVRLDLLCSVFVSVVTFTCVYWSSSLSSEIIGLTITYAFMMVNLFQFCIRVFIDVENMMTSAERILDYIDLEPEALQRSSQSHAPGINWPTMGCIDALDVTMSYCCDAPLALDAITFNIKSEEKIGIVGRTGAGKSSLIAMLFRLNEHGGLLKIDGVDISSVGLHDLRSKISIIPQDPVLFIGTLRSNLDPFKKFEDSYLWNTLAEVQLRNTIENSAAGLDMRVLEGGSNFSVGQRQLLCLARALLNRNRILIIDEATANVDPVTDDLIQQTIRQKFKECTILTIAHRIHTIMDSHRIMVMDKGRIVEFDTPANLLNKKSGEFYNLAKKVAKQNMKIE